MNKKSKIIPVILCGGTGSRLWPLSRESFPKQYLSLTENNKSLLQNTMERINPLSNILNPILICNEEHRFIVAEQMREINTTPLSIMLEPFGRNTAPAIALSAIKALEQENDPILLILSSDHEIKNIDKFITVIKRGLEYAERGKLATFGVIPTNPETGYGYIKADSPFLDEEIIGKKIKEFTEKPDLETASKFIKDKSYTWNSGIFIFQAKLIIEEIKRYSPNIFEACQKTIEKSRMDLEFTRLENDSFKNCPDVSIDQAVMEKTQKGIVLPLDVGWSDIGSWQAVWANSKKDNDGNTLKGNIIANKTKNCYLRSEKRLLVGIGLNDLIAVETNDAILICDKSQSQKVKNIVNNLRKNNISEGKSHKKIYRPWGNYTSIFEEKRWQVKLIEVNPGGKLSLQMHHHRSEHWIVVRGTARVEIDKEINILSENQSTYIPLGIKHRLSNPGKIPLSLIEVQSGSYVGEDDIVRFDDIYNRSS
ncbi:mannose-1-phosphate guanylyltransferase/mannose-6-phosphate isomerase [Prochlorococcus sp. AH-716-N03]|nr:mannose-1-phosphate guanylyltransferase/mannose-6-phosphate isomerase [Prochlorococcus sp. AH-716-N03]